MSAFPPWRLPHPALSAAGLVVSVLLIAAETIVVYPLRRLTTEAPMGMIYLLGVLVVATLWGLKLAVLTLLASGAAFFFFHVPPTLTLEDRGKGWVAVTIFVVVGFLVSMVAEAARRRAIEASDLAGSLATLAGDQAALRRIATLVARGVPPSEVFAAVAAETGRLLEAAATAVARREPDGELVLLAVWGGPAARVFPAVGSALPPGDGFAGLSALRCPIAGAGGPWGELVALSADPAGLPDAAADRMMDFSDLVATAIANAESRTQLATSRARVVAAADETRRRIERDLHDGTQQRLISLALQVRSAEAMVPPELGPLRRQLERIARGLATVVEELQEIARGIHPAILSRSGLGAALRGLARRSTLPVDLSISGERRLPEPVEVAVYYVTSEALANAAKHAGASRVRVELRIEDDVLRLAVRDDGAGGADSTRGSGLVGLVDRVESLGGTLEVSSPRGGGTTLAIELPAGRV